MTSVRLGVVGVGHVGTSHARELAAGRVAGASLAGIADPSARARASFPDVPSFASAADLIGSGAIDALVIATPHYSHTPLAIDALRAGLHVLCEKPLAVHKADCLSMIAAYEQRPRHSQVFAEMLSQRIDPAFVELRSLLSEGALGGVQRVSWFVTDWFRSEAYYRESKWRGTWAGEGGGVLLNQCPHQLDLWQWLFGMPQRLHAFCDFGRFHEIEVEDQVTAYLAYDSGLTGVFVASTGEAPGSNRLEVSGDLGKAVIDARGLELSLNQRSARACLQAGDARSGKPITSSELRTFPRLENPRRRVLENFVATILGSERLIAPASEGIFSVELANAMIYSALSKSTVELPLDPALYAAALTKLVAGSRASS